MLRLLAGLLALSTLVVADEVEKIDVFRAGERGYKLYRIPGVVVTQKGTVITYGEARRGDSGDWGTIDLVARRSADGGRTWGEPIPFPQVEGPKQKNPVALAQNLAAPDAVTYNNPVLIPDRAGIVHGLFCMEYARCFYIRSEDDGVTWSAPVEITATFEKVRPVYHWKVLATGPGHGIQLRSGRLLIPVWLSTGTGGHAHRPSVTTTIYSDDGGKTWVAGEIAVPNTPEWVNPNETVAVELADGKVMLNVRSESKPQRRLITTSADGVKDWSAPRFDEGLFEPVCFASLVRLRDARTLVFSNPDPETKKRDRKNLTLKVSEDDGATWPVSRVLEADRTGYSDLAQLSDGTLLCFYERSSTDGKSDAKTGVLTLARVPLNWLRGGKQ